MFYLKVYFPDGTVKSGTSESDYISDLLSTVEDKEGAIKYEIGGEGYYGREIISDDDYLSQFIKNVDTLVLNCGFGSGLALVDGNSPLIGIKHIIFGSEVTKTVLNMGRNELSEDRPFSDINLDGIETFEFKSLEVPTLKTLFGWVITSLNSRVTNYSNLKAIYVPKEAYNTYMSSDNYFFQALRDKIVAKEEEGESKVIDHITLKGETYEIADAKAREDIEKVNSLTDNFLTKLEAMGMYATKDEVEQTYVKKSDISYENNTLIIK